MIWLGIYDALHSIEILRHNVLKAEQIIKDRTDLHADIHYKSSNCIIAVGRYRNKDYVQVYNIAENDFHYFITRFKEMERYGHMARVDSPPTMHAVFEHEFNNK